MNNNNKKNNQGNELEFINSYEGEYNPKDSYKKRYRKSYEKRRKKRLKIIIGSSISIIAAIFLVHNFISPMLSLAALDMMKSRDNDIYRNEGDNNSDTPNYFDNQENSKVNNKVTDMDPDDIKVLINKEIALPKDYEPEDLVVPNVKFYFSHYEEKKLLRKEAAEALEELFLASVQEELNLCAVSGYRSYNRQYTIFTSNVRKNGLEETLKFSAMPGFSEHQTGLSMDVSTPSLGNLLVERFEDTKEGQWLAQKAHEFGYIIRYPKNKEDITLYTYEPWHIRYVGIDLATYLYENDLCLEEYYDFEPDPFYFTGITYDNLEEFGISLDDVKQSQPTESASNKRPKKEEKNTQKATEDEPETEPEELTPTPTPSPEPTKEPTVTPSPKPTKEPSVTPKPTKEPTVTPNPEPTREPSVTPTPKPTKEPTATPSPKPTKEPTVTPTSEQPGNPQ